VLRVETLQSRTAGVVPAGYLLGTDCFDLSARAENLRLRELRGASRATKAPSFTADDTRIVISGGSFRYEFDCLTGVFSAMSANNRPLITRPMEYNIWRAPTDNDRNIRIQWQELGYHRTVSHAYSPVCTAEGSDVVIRGEVSLASVARCRSVTLQTEWRVSPDGTVTAKLDGTRRTDLPFLPRFGLRLFLPREASACEYFGFGPGESYCDKHRASYLSRFVSDCAAMHEDYIRPQENSSHFGCEYVLAGGRLLAWAEKPISFNFSRYTQEELTEKAHNYELVPCESNVLCLDYRMSGVGSNSCGPELLPQYRLCEDQFSFTLHLKPVQ